MRALYSTLCAVALVAVAALSVGPSWAGLDEQRQVHYQ